jgi:hypothetical protein
VERAAQAFRLFAFAGKLVDQKREGGISAASGMDR